jgi:hypothetical protein
MFSHSKTELKFFLSFIAPLEIKPSKQTLWMGDDLQNDLLDFWKQGYGPHLYTATRGLCND